MKHYLKHYLWEARAYYRQVAGLLFLGSACGIVLNVAVILPFILLGRAIDVALAVEQGQAAVSDVVRAACAYVGGSMLYFLTRMGKRWWLRTAVRRAVANVRADALRGVLSWPMEWFHQEPIGDLMSRIIGDADVFGRGFNESTTELWDTWLFSFSLVGAMIAYDPRLTLLVLLPVPLAMFLAYASRKWVRERTLSVRVANADLSVALQEHLAGIRILRLFGRTDEAVDRIDRLSGRLRQANLAEARLRLGLQPIYSILIISGVILVVWLGGQSVIRGVMTTGGLVAFMQLYLRFVLRGHRIPLFFNRIQSAGVGWDRLRRLMAEPLPVALEPRLASFRPAHVTGLYRAEAAAPGVSTGPLSARLRDVVFRYPGAPSRALEGVSLDIPAGSLIAITGPVGSGKSALLRALIGLYPLEDGQVLVDGRPIEGMSPAERASRIGYVPQDPGLFSGSVLENIGLEDAKAGGDEGLLRRVIAQASLERDVGEFLGGVEAQIGEGGIRVSGGQRQRIAIARALAVSRRGSPGMLLLDDPFAAIDVETEGLIIGALREAFGPSAPPDRRATIVLCSHRLAAFRHADLVVVLDQGRVAAKGSHQELLAAGGLYARIYRAQHEIEQGIAPEEIA